MGRGLFEISDVIHVTSESWEGVCPHNKGTSCVGNPTQASHWLCIRSGVSAQGSLPSPFAQQRPLVAQVDFCVKWMHCGRYVMALASYVDVNVS